MCLSNENSYCCFQIHTGDAQSPTFGSTTFMLFWFSSDGGSVHDYSGTELAKNLGNQWFQLNVDHNLVTHTIRVWINQKLVWTQQDNGATDFYFKDGVYEQDHGPTLEMDTFITNSIKMWASSGTNPPAAPTGLVATPTITQIGLAWNSSIGATNYNLKRSAVNGSSYATIASLTGTSYTDSNATNGTTYYYVVTAVDNFGESSNSTQVSASLSNTGYQLVAAPASQSMAAGSSTNFTVAMTTNSSFSGSVTFGVTGLPAGANANFSPSLNVPGISTLTVNTISNTAGGNYTLTIAGTNGGFVVTTNVVLSLSGVAVNPGTLLWTAGGGDTSWSTVLDWTNLTASGNGPPGPVNNLIFTNTAAVNSPGTINNVMDGNFTVGSLQFNNNALNTSPNYHVTLINDGQTLLLTNGLMVGTGTDAGLNNVVNAAITGANGTLTLSNGDNLSVQQGSATDGAHEAVLDLSGLGNLSVTNVSRITVGVYQTVTRACGVLYLAETNFISVTSTGVTNGILVGWNDSNGNGDSSGVLHPGDNISALYLGQANSIYADAIYVGTDKTVGCLLTFNPNGLNNPTAYFRGSGGANSRVSFGASATAR